MAQDVTAVSHPGHGLPNTHWSEVQLAKSPDTPQGVLALDSLLTRYREASIAHLRSKFQLAKEDAEDILHGFVERKVLKHALLRRAEPSQGRFRTFFLRSLDRFAISALRRNRARKRNPPSGLICLHDLEDGEMPSVHEDGEPAFDLVWTRVVITGAVLNMYNECTQKGRQAVWEVFIERILGPEMDGTEMTSYDELVCRHGLNSPSDAFNLLATAKRIFRRHLRIVVAEYTANDAETEEELVQLRKLCLRGSGRRQGKAQPKPRPPRSRRIRPAPTG